jgi:hypothetical protein
MTQQTSLNGSAKRESYSAPWTSNYWATKYTDRYPSQALSSDCCEYSTLGKQSWALKEADRSKLEAFHHECLRKMCGLTMWDVAEKRITNEHVRGMVANSPTMDTLMETRRCRWLQTQCNGRVKISRRMLAWCTTARPVGRPQQTIRHAYIIFSEARWRERQLWMTVARDRSAWGRKVEYKLELRAHSRISADIERNTNDILTNC